jgi:hypothetical protein
VAHSISVSMYCSRNAAVSAAIGASMAVVGVALTGHTLADVLLAVGALLFWKLPWRFVLPAAMVDLALLAPLSGRISEPHLDAVAGFGLCLGLLGAVKLVFVSDTSQDLAVQSAVQPRLDPLPELPREPQSPATVSASAPAATPEGSAPDGSPHDEAQTVPPAVPGPRMAAASPARPGSESVPAPRTGRDDAIRNAALLAVAGIVSVMAMRQVVRHFRRAGEP